MSPKYTIELTGAGHVRLLILPGLGIMLSTERRLGVMVLWPMQPGEPFRPGG